MSEEYKPNLETFFDKLEEIHRKAEDSCQKRQTVMFTDITASTAFFDIHGDFEGAYLIHHYSKTMIPIIKSCSGEIVKSLGDGLLVIFDSCEQSCQAAIKMQQATKDVNKKFGKKEGIFITIGLHFGEFVSHGNDIFGDTVNVASRTASMAGPGTILITHAVKEHIQDNNFLISFGTKAIFKGKRHPIELYHLHWDQTEIDRSIGYASKCELRAFISTVTPHNDIQTRFLEGFSRRLVSIGIEPIFLKQSYYDRRSPIEKTAKQIDDCNFMILLGLERSHSYFLKDRELSDSESEAIHRRYTSGWLHLEAGLGHALGKEIFVLCTKDIFSDGIFDRDWNTYPVYEFETLNAFSDSLQPFWDKLTKWVEDERKRRIENS